MVVRPEHYGPQQEEYRLESGKEMRLKGARKGDPEKIAAWIKREYLEAETRLQ
jgi:hypothetical protein